MAYYEARLLAQVWRPCFAPSNPINQVTAQHCHGLEYRWTIAGKPSDVEYCHIHWESIPNTSDYSSFSPQGIRNNPQGQWCPIRCGYFTTLWENRNESALRELYQSSWRVHSKCVFPLYASWENRTAHSRYALIQECINCSRSEQVYAKSDLIDCRGFDDCPNNHDCDSHFPPIYFRGGKLYLQQPVVTWRKLTEADRRSSEWTASLKWTLRIIISLSPLSSGFLLFVLSL